MTLLKSFCLTATAVSLFIAGQSAAMAADDCMTQVKALAPTVESTTDAAVKEKVVELLKKADSEATEESDEDECLDYLKDAKELLGVK